MGVGQIASVYVITEGSYSSYRIVSIWDSMGAAKKALAIYKKGRDVNGIETYDLNAMSQAIEHTLYVVEWYPRTGRYFKEIKTATDPSEFKAAGWSAGHVTIYKGGDSPYNPWQDSFVRAVSGTSHDHALKMAQDLWYQKTAEREGLA